MLRLRVVTTSLLGNPREIIVACEDQVAVDRRKDLYKKRYPLADFIVEEIKGDDNASIETGVEEKKVKKAKKDK